MPGKDACEVPIKIVTNKYLPEDAAVLVDPVTVASLAGLDEEDAIAILLQALIEGRACLVRNRSESDGIR